MMNGAFDHKSLFTFEQRFHNYENDRGNRTVENRLYDIQQGKSIIIYNYYLEHQTINYRIK